MKCLPNFLLSITMMIDTHIHFERFVDDFREAINQIEFNRIFCGAVSLDLPSYDLTLEIAEQTELLLPAFGIHPIQASSHIEKMDVIREKASTALMLGEIGLDKYYI